MNAVDHVMLFPTMRCNYRCRHCGWSCEPGVGDDMSLDMIKNYINQLPELRTKKFGITGGEPTLYEDLDEVILHVGNVRRQTGYPKLIYMNTNVSWVQDKVSASTKLREWKRFGLDELRPSYDKYHQEFTPEYKIQILRNLTGKNNMPEICGLKKIGVTPVGRARHNIPKNELLDPPYECYISGMVLRDDWPEYNERFLSIFPDGVYVCDFRIGYLGDGRLSELATHAMKNPLFKIIGELSVKRTLEQIWHKIPLRMQEKTKTLHECTLCHDIFQDKEILDIIMSESTQLLEHIRRLNEEPKRQIEEARAYDIIPIEEKIKYLKEKSPELAEVLKLN